MNSDNNKELFRFREYGIDTSTKRKLVDAVKYLQSIGEDVSDNTIIRMNEHSNPCVVYKSLICYQPLGLGRWNGSPSDMDVVYLSEFKKIYKDCVSIKVGDFISFEYNGFHYNGFVELLYDNGNVRLVSVYTQEGNFKKLLIKDAINPQRANPSNMKEIASKYKKFKNKDKMAKRVIKKGDYVSLKLKNGRSVLGFVYSVSPINVAVASGKSFKLHLGVDSSKVSHQTVKPTPEFKKRYVSWLDSQDKPIIPKTEKPSVETKDCWIHDVTPQNLKSFVGIPITVEVDRDNGESIMFLDVIVSVDESFVYLTKDGKHLISKVLRFGKLLEANQYKMLEDEYKERLSRKTSVDSAEKGKEGLFSEIIGLAKHIREILDRNTEALRPVIGIPISLTIKNINSEEARCLGIVTKINESRGVLEFFTTYTNNDFTERELDVIEIHLLQVVEFATVKEDSSFYEEINSYFTAYLEASDVKLFKLDELNENQYVEISSVEEYKSYCEIANHLGLKWSVGLVHSEHLSAMIELWKTGEKIYISPKIGVWIEAKFIKKPKHQVIPLSQIEKPTIISGNEVTEPEFELSDNSGEFDPDKPFEVSDDGETWIDDFTHYIGVCPNMNIHFVSKTGCYDSFNFIRNTPMIKIKRSEITGVITKDGTFKNFDIID